MRALSASELLDIWEQGLAEPPIQRALLLLNAACPELSFEALSNLSIGRRDAKLLQLRRWAFGPEISGLTGCPSCSESVELNLDIDDILITDPSQHPDPSHSPDDAISGSFLCRVADYEIHYRPANSADVVAVANLEDLSDRKNQLLRRCVLAIYRDGAEQSWENMPAELGDAVERYLASADPLAAVELALDCPSCRHRWKKDFDIVTYFWTEIDIWAQRMLSEIHMLAFAYGWRESDILAMSARRRQYYLSMVSG